jgi:hypothetical protein
MREADIQTEAMLTIGSLPRVRVFRNHVGMDWSGRRSVRRATASCLRTRIRHASG